MTNDDEKVPRGRVVLHRHGARRAYAIAVVVDEGPYTLQEAHTAAAQLLREMGWVSKADAAEALGVTERQVDYLREAGRLKSVNTETNHVLISLESLGAEFARRAGE